MAQIHIVGNRLDEFAKRIRGAMGDADRGPLVIARQVVDLADNWDKYQEEAEGKSCSQWLLSIGSGGRRDVAWFTKRAEAVETMGEHSRRVWNHEALVWAVGQFKDVVTLRRLDREVQAKSRDEQSGGALTKAQVANLAKKLGLVASAKKKRVCGRCQELEALLVASGVEVPT